MGALYSKGHNIKRQASALDLKELRDKKQSVI